MKAWQKLPDDAMTTSVHTHATASLHGAHYGSTYHGF